MPAIDLRLDPDPDASVEVLVRSMIHRRFLGEYADPERAAVAAEAWATGLLPRARLFEVRAQDGHQHGQVWLLEQGDGLAVLALTLDDHRLAPDVRELVLDLARAEGSRRLTVGVAPGDPALEGFVHGRHFEVSALQMRLDLEHTLPAEDTVELEAMDQASYEVYRARGNAEFAEVLEKSGETPKRAREVAEQQLAGLLSDGRATAGHHFFTGTVRGEAVGTLWLSTTRPMVFVYDVVVEETHRRRGFGAGLMRAAALWSRREGAHAIGLNVFGYNHGAKALYDRLGYHVVEEFVAHTIEPRP